MTWKLFFMKIGVHSSFLNKNFINIQCSTNYILKHDSNLSFSSHIYSSVFAKATKYPCGCNLNFKSWDNEEEIQDNVPDFIDQRTFSPVLLCEFFKVSIASYLKSYLYSTIFCKKNVKSVGREWQQVKT